MVDDRKAVHLLIKGRVQGVGYRDWTRMKARMAGLDGWVRNLSTGEVEAVVAGPPGAVENLLAACRIGPPSARVVDMEVTEAEAPSEPGFRKLPTL